MKRPKLGPRLFRRRDAPTDSISAYVEPLKPRGDEYLLSNTLPLPGAGADGNEALNLLASGIVEQHIAYGRRGLAVCGASAGAGVTFVAASLAMAVARTGVSTLLVDANLHRPGVQYLIQPPRSTPGLQELLESEGAIDLDPVRHDIMPQFAVIYAGKSEISPSELLAGGRLRDVVFACLRDFRCVVFDTPPANRSPDARMIGAAVGYALLVARRGESYADDLTMLARQLEQDHIAVVGGVLNEG